VTLQLALLPIAAALAPQLLDCRIAREAEQLEINLIDDGLDGFVIAAILDDQRNKWEAWRRLLMPSMACH
jgi:hypothetical protein